MPYGNSSAEALQKIKTFGYNELVEGHKVTVLGTLFRQVRSNFIVYLLLTSAIISFSVGKVFTAVVILTVIVVVIMVGFIQEFRAEQSIASLKKMITLKTMVYRDGKKRELLSRELVPDDLISLGNGEKVPADCKLVEAYELRLNESALTGESREISKSADGIDPNSQNLFMGTYIVNGRCKAVITHTGMNTEFGKIAHLISEAEKELPLQIKINEIVKYMVVVALIAAISTGALMLFRSTEINNAVLIEILILVVAISVSSFPEGFPVVLITTLAMGAKRMALKNAVVNRMSIIETLGETTVICSDKTGTITKGEMAVKFVFTSDSLYEIDGVGYGVEGQIRKNNVIVEAGKEPDLNLLLKSIVTCNDSEIEKNDEATEYKITGTPTEAAMLVLGAKAGVYPESESADRLSEVPFNSSRKMMSVLVQGDSENYVYAKGAPEILIKKCTRIFKKGNFVEMTDKDRVKIEEMRKEMSNNAFRTLAVAFNKVPNVGQGYSEDDLVFLGLVAMEDGPREEVAESIALAKEAGVRVIMITGDNSDTAVSVAKQIGLDGDILEGKDLDALSDDELKIKIKSVSVFARVQPNHKIRIVRILKDLDEIVAMTGDGVNDAPALKEAHIGIAMGKNGTDVSRSASDLILKDDNFSTIVDSIAEGRNVFNNIRKFVTYQLSCNLAEIIILFFGVLLAPVFGWEVPLLFSIQILFMNLVTDNLPSITLGLNPTSRDIMQVAPLRNAKILNKNMIFILIGNGLLMAIFTLAAYSISLHFFGLESGMGRTSALVALIVIEIAVAFSFRSFRQRTLDRSPFSNKYLAIASGISFLATLIVIYTPLNVAFETNPITLLPWTLSFGFAFLALVIHDLVKTFVISKMKFTD